MPVKNTGFRLQQRLGFLAPNTGLDTPHVFPVSVLYFVSRPTRRVALCSARNGASLSRNHSARRRADYFTK